MKNQISRIIAFALVLTLLIPAFPAKAATVTPKLNVTTKTITGIGKTYTLKVTKPTGTTATFKSSNTKIATVSSAGKITTVKGGTATITCTVLKAKKTLKKLTCKVTILVPAKKIRINNAKIDPEFNSQVIQMGSKYDFNRTITSSSKKSASTDKTVWVVKDPTIAKISGGGVLTPLKAGTTTLTVCAGKNKAAALDEDNTILYSIGIKIVNPAITVTTNLNSAQQLQINFSQAMNESTLLLSNKQLSNFITVIPKNVGDNVSKDPGKLTGVLSSDKKSLTINCENVFDGTYELRLTKEVLSEKGIPIEPFTRDLVLKDTTGPSYTGTVLDDTGLIAKISFSEPVNVSSLTPKNPRGGNSSVFNYLLTTKENYKLAQDKQSLSIDLSALSQSGGNSNYTIDLYGITDMSGNASTPYPLVATLYTDTSMKPQANCLNIVRNGQSLIATFDRSIQNPGYAIVNGTSLNGVVNTDNKKEVIYTLTSNLTGLTGSVLVTLSGYSGYNVATSTMITQCSKTINFSATSNGPMISTSTLTTKLINGSRQTILTLTYNKEVKVIAGNGTLSATSNVDGLVGASMQYSYTATAEEKTVSVILNGSFTELGVYTFSIPTNFVVDFYNNQNAATTITAVKRDGVTDALPGPSSILVDSDNSSIIYVTFPNTIDDSSATTTNNYSFGNLPIQSATLLSNTLNNAAIVQITLAGSAKVEDGIPYPVRISGIRGYKNSYSVMNTYSSMLTLSNTKTLSMTNCAAYSADNKVVLTFENALSSASQIDYSFTQNGTALTIKITPVFANNTLTFYFNEKLIKNGYIKAIPNSGNNIYDLSNNRFLNTQFNTNIQ